VGSGGDGVVTLGELLVSVAARAGAYAIMTKAFGPQVRGGESSCRVRIASAPLHGAGGDVDHAVIHDFEDYAKLASELPVGPESIVVFDTGAGGSAASAPFPAKPREVRGLPLSELSRKAAKSPRSRASVALGMIATWLELPEAPLAAELRARLASRGEDFVRASDEAFRAGVELARSSPLAPSLAVPRAREATRLVADGNAMCAAGAIFAGCDLYAGYPITPASEIMHRLARELPRYGGVVLQAEDEIAAIGAAFGASFGGKRAMTASSGPGLSLEAEILGLATISETPLVVVDVQRAGPSTGIPTKPEQADLFQACFSAHGSVVRPVLAPTNVAETFTLTVEAFSIAERFQTPVLLLSDQEIAQRTEVIDPLDTSGLVVAERKRPADGDPEPYSRFRLTDDGVSPMSHPGMPNTAYQGAGIEHDERGSPATTGAMHARMTRKRFDKLRPLADRRDLIRESGPDDAPIVVISWGSTAGTCREAVALLAERGLAVKLVVPWLLFPVPERRYREIFASVRGGLVVEMSHEGQLHKLLRMFVDVPPSVRSMSRSGGLPFSPEEIVRAVLEVHRGIE
jgi:2-oxoglutarate ferredoxin oxidoreductase subunit alpha